MPEKDPVQRLRRLSGLIGDTPLLAIEFMFRDKKRKIYAKAESFNLTGSIKDRMSYTIMEKAYIRGTLKECNPAVRLHPLQPAGSPFLSVENKEGGHRIEGIADGYIPPILDLQDLDSIISVDDGDAILMARKLAAELGLGVGISSGANFLGALEVQERMGNNAAVVTLFPDDNKKYLSTDLFRKEPLQDWFLSPHVTLLGVESYAGSYCKSHLPQK